MKTSLEKVGNREASNRLDARIARLLFQNQALSQKDLADKLEQPGTLIKQRRAYLQKKQILVRLPVILDWEAIGLSLRFRIDIQIDQKALLAEKGGGAVGMPTLNTQEGLALFIHRDLIEHMCSKNNRLSYLKEHLLVEDVAILLGNPVADICAIVRAKNNVAVLKFVTGGLRMMPAVARTSTYHEAWSSSTGTL